MQNPPPTTESVPTSYVDDEIDLLDLLLVVAQNLRLLVLGSLACGLAALGGASLWPKTFEATAIISAEQSFATVLKSPVVLDAVSRGQPSVGNSATEEARDKLLQKVQASFSAKDKTVTLTVRESSPEQAQELGRLLLGRAFEQSRPRGSERERLERQLSQARERQKEAAGNAALLSTRLASARGGSAEAAQGYAQLVGTIEGIDKLIAEYEHRLAGVDESRMLQDITARQKPVAPKVRLVTVLGTLAGGFMLLIFVFVRQAWRRAGENAEGAHKLASIRRALRGG